MELVNELYAFSEQTEIGSPARHVAASTQTSVLERPGTIAVVTEAVDALVRMLAPFAPHTGEELWEMLGHTGGLAAVELAGIRCRGREGGRDRRAGPDQRQGARPSHGARRDARNRSSRRVALADPAVKAHTQGKTIRKVVVVKGKLVSIVVSVGSRRVQRSKVTLGVALSLRRELGLWLRARRPWLVPARLHPASSASRRSRIAAASLRWSRSSPKRCAPSSSGAASTRSSPTRSGVGRRALRVRFSRSRSSPSGSTSSSSRRGTCSPGR